MSIESGVATGWRLSDETQANDSTDNSTSAGVGPSSPTMSDEARVKLFIAIQILFLILTPFCGWFHFSLWSMMDTALMIQAIGITALVVVLDREWMRVLAFRVAILFYLSALTAMGVAVLVSGVVGWSRVFSLMPDRLWESSKHQQFHDTCVDPYARETPAPRPQAPIDRVEIGLSRFLDPPDACYGRARAADRLSFGEHSERLRMKPRSPANLRPWQSGQSGKPRGRPNDNPPVKTAGQAARPISASTRNLRLACAEILLRADSGFARDELMAWCEAHQVDYLLGLARNPRLVGAIAEQLGHAWTPPLERCSPHVRATRATRATRQGCCVGCATFANSTTTALSSSPPGASKPDCVRPCHGWPVLPSGLPGQSPKSARRMIFTRGQRARIWATIGSTSATTPADASMFERLSLAASRCRPQKTYSGR